MAKYASLEIVKEYSNRRRTVVRVKGWLGRRASEKSLKRYCLEIWSQLVRERDGRKCFLCGSTEKLQAHHLISKSWTNTAYNPMCGITLCHKHHDKSILAVHASPWLLEDSLRKRRPEQYDWFLKERVKISSTPTEPNLKQSLEFLLTEFEKIAPIAKQRHRHFRFTEEEENQIAKEYSKGKIGMVNLGKKWGCSSELIYRICNQKKIAMRRVGRPLKSSIEI